MTDMTAFEQQLAAGFKGLMGPSEPVDDLAVFTAITATQSPAWRVRPLFSALKFVVAGVIVALFGGFLLAGILATPNGDEMAPGEATESPSPMTAEELLSGMVTEEVEPGVYRVVNDGVRDLTDLSVGVPPPSSTIVAGQDGSIWLARSGGLVRLGDSDFHDPRTDESDGLRAFAIAPDGQAWAVVESGGLLSLDGDTWTTHPDVGRSRLYFPQGHVEVAPSGRVWMARMDGALSYLEADGSTWQTTEGWPTSDWPPTPGWSGFIATDSGVWTPSQDGIWHYAEGTWERTRYGGPDTLPLPDGVFWSLGMGDPASGDFASDETLHRHDEGGWQRWSLEEQGMLPVWGATPNEYAIAPDGSFWAGWSVFDRDTDTVLYPGISRFDGQTWMRYLPGTAALGMDIAPDGSVWVVARESHDYEAAQGPEPEANLYVITPEAVAAASE